MAGPDTHTFLFAAGELSSSRGGGGGAVPCAFVVTITRRYCAVPAPAFLLAHAAPDGGGTTGLQRKTALLPVSKLENGNAQGSD